MHSILDSIFESDFWSILRPPSTHWTSKKMVFLKKATFFEKSPFEVNIDFRCHFGANLAPFWHQKSIKIHPKTDLKRHQKIGLGALGPRKSSQGHPGDKIFTNFQVRGSIPTNFHEFSRFLSIFFFSDYSYCVRIKGHALCLQVPRLFIELLQLCTVIAPMTNGLPT